MAKPVRLVWPYVRRALMALAVNPAFPLSSSKETTARRNADTASTPTPIQFARNATTLAQTALGLRSRNALNASKAIC